MFQTQEKAAIAATAARKNQQSVCRPRGLPKETDWSIKSVSL